MSAEFSTEYHAEGSFPESERILLVGPRKKTFTTLVVHGKQKDDKPYSDYNYTGELEVDGKEIKGKILFEKNQEGEPFKSSQELLDFLVKKYHITYLRDKSKPAVETG